MSRLQLPLVVLMPLVVLLPLVVFRRSGDESTLVVRIAAPMLGAVFVS